jgi:divinyl chlorophyllide a 8-vinyl-reductase
MSTPQRVFMLGASGSIGRATAHELVRRGHEVTCLLRRSLPDGTLPEAARVRLGSVADPATWAQGGLCGERFDAVVSCLASRSGVAAEAWAIDHLAHRHALAAAQGAGVRRFVLLSALCVQKPRLAFQHAKRAFEADLAASGLAASIVRPTAFFKSITGQVERVSQGAPYLVFGDGRLTACKPIADEDLAAYLANCLDDERPGTQILPIGGPGPALTPHDLAEHLFGELGRPLRIRRVPLALLDGIAATLGTASRLMPFVPVLATKAELARIGRYYASESMLVWDAAAGRYDADATPEFGQRSVLDFQSALVRGELRVERGEHAVF